MTTEALWAWVEGDAFGVIVVLLVVLALLLEIAGCKWRKQ